MDALINIIKHFASSTSVGDRRLLDVCLPEKYEANNRRWNLPDQLIPCTNINECCYIRTYRFNPAPIAFFFFVYVLI